MTSPLPLRARQKFGKYRVVRKLASGPFSTVYEAHDTIEGIRVAVKVLAIVAANRDMLTHIQQEVRLTSQLDHPNVMAIKNATVIDEQFVVVYPMGQQTLQERLTRRIALRLALDFGHQLLEALAHAHEHQVIHCDVKPENLIIFAGNKLRLTDFGLAKVSPRTVRATGSGTLGYMAPEQAMGKPSPRSDVFSAGLVIYRMLSGHLPEWPFTWPPPGHARLRERVPRGTIALLRQSIEADPHKRFADAREMLAHYRKTALGRCPTCGQPARAARSRP